MTTLRFLGAVCAGTILLGLALHLASATIVALLFFGGCGAIGIALIARSISKHW